MKKMIPILLNCLFIMTLEAGLGFHTTGPLLDVENEIIQKLSENHFMSDKTDIQGWCEYKLGLSLLLSLPITIDLGDRIRDGNIVEIEDTEAVLDQYLAADPKNKLAWFMKAESVCESYRDEYKLLHEDMQRTIEYSRKLNYDKLLIPSVSLLYPLLMKYEHPEYLEKTKEGLYLIYPGDFMLDYDKAEELLGDYLDKRYLSVHETILEAQKQDPDNACYPYLLAGLYMTNGLEQDGITQLQIAEQKNATLYNDHRQQLLSKLVKALSLSEETEKLCLSKKQDSFESWCNRHWSKDLIGLIEKHEKQGNITKAKEYTDLGIRLLDKIPESELLYPPNRLKPIYLKKVEKLNKMNIEQ